MASQTACDFISLAYRGGREGLRGVKRTQSKCLAEPALALIHLGNGIADLKLAVATAEDACTILRAEKAGQ